jgi:pimeloyl-ACP methyl ester carboxylesterase
VSDGGTTPFLRLSSFFSLLWLLGVWPATPQVSSLEEGQDLLERGRWGKATTTFRQILRQDPESDEAWLGLVRAQRGKGDLAGALESSEIAIGFLGIEADAYYERGCVLAAMGEADEAITALRTALTSGFADRHAMVEEPALTELSYDPRFRRPSPRREKILQAGDLTLRYLVTEPAELDPNHAYPVLVAIGHGRQDLGSARFLLDKFVGEQAAQLGWVVIAPEAPRDGWAGAAGEMILEALLDEVADNYRLERDKFFLLGNGQGAASALHLALTVPDRLSWVVTLSGSASSTGDLERLVGTRVRQYVGEKDVTWIGAVRAVDEALREAGVVAEMRVVASDGHYLRSLTGDRLMRELDRLRRSCVPLRSSIANGSRWGSRGLGDSFCGRVRRKHGLPSSRSTSTSKRWSSMTGTWSSVFAIPSRASSRPTDWIACWAWALFPLP